MTMLAALPKLTKRHIDLLHEISLRRYGQPYPRNWSPKTQKDLAAHGMLEYRKEGGLLAAAITDAGKDYLRDLQDTKND